MLYTIHQLLHIVKWDIGQVDSAFLRVRHDAVAPFYVFEFVIFLVLAPFQGHAHYKTKILKFGVRLEMAGAIELIEHCEDSASGETPCCAFFSAVVVT